jgi:Asp-tRNA(Asn)/Glu-tRNA(Gln) amidotransferase A subunit family amidase
MFPYNPRVVSFSHALPRLRSGKDTPRALLERCIEAIAAHESRVKAFVALDLEAARAAADASTRRYREGRPLSGVDGCPVGVKDIMDTHDLPTQMGSPAFAGWRPRYDAACVQALRGGGAVIVGKTATTAFACGGPAATTHPHDARRTPGGSSSGSAAAVGAGMLPVALGTQTQGSTLRPASYCGIVGFKPTHGVLSMQGVHPISASHDHLGVLAGTLQDAWRIASRLSLAHGAPGQPFLQRAADGPPRAVKPRRLLRLYTPGWEAETDGATRAAFEALLDAMARSGVTIVSRDDDDAAAGLERLLDEGFVARSLDVTAYEMQWPYQQYVTTHGEHIEQRVHDRLRRARAMTPADYAARLAEKAQARRRVRALMRGCDGIVTLAASGPAPLGLGHTGSRSFLVYATFLGLPAFSLPLMRVDGLPLGLQLIGAAGKDGALCAHAHWMMRHLAA